MQRVPLPRSHRGGAILCALLFGDPSPDSVNWKKNMSAEKSLILRWGPLGLGERLMLQDPTVAECYYFLHFIAIIGCVHWGENQDIFFLYSCYVTCYVL